jgi:hypothetical protein
MQRFIALFAAVLALAAGAAVPAAGQGGAWAPPSRAMPEMPAMAELDGAWRGALAAWFRGTDEISGVPLAQVRATGEAGTGGRSAYVRFMGGPRAVAVWSDRNGDGRADMIEIYRGGSVAFQLIDSNYDGHANVLRAYDSGGALLRETRY